MEENLEKKLLNKKESGWIETDDERFSKIFKFCEGYMNFLNKSKTEREFAFNAKKLAEEKSEWKKYYQIAEMIKICEILKEDIQWDWHCSNYSKTK